MDWISVKDGVPPLPQDRFSESYLVVVQRKGLPKRIRIAKWEKKLHRKPLSNESVHQVLKESLLGKWIISGVKGSEITHWMPLPESPREEDELD